MTSETHNGERCEEKKTYSGALMASYGYCYQQHMYSQKSEITLF